MRTRSFAAALATFAAIGLAAPTADAQIVKVGYTDIGAVVGLGNIGDASISFGGRFEKIIKDLPDMGNGVLGINVSADYYGWSNTFASFSYIPIGATGNYHFKLENEKVVPFLGLGLGYQVISCDIKGSGLGDLCSNSALYFIGRAGIRYFYKPNMALYADAGAGAATLNVGVTFKLK
jgi:hypothetical protein